MTREFLSRPVALSFVVTAALSGMAALKPTDLLIGLAVSSAIIGLILAGFVLIAYD